MILITHVHAMYVLIAHCSAKITGFMINMKSIKTHGRVSVAKEVMWHTSVLFTGTAKSPFSTPHISITTGPISIKFTYFMSSIYTTLHTKFEENRRSIL